MVCFLFLFLVFLLIEIGLVELELFCKVVILFFIFILFLDVGLDVVFNLLEGLIIFVGLFIFCLNLFLLIGVVFLGEFVIVVLGLMLNCCFEFIIFLRLLEFERLLG